MAKKQEDKCYNLKDISSESDIDDLMEMCLKDKKYITMEMVLNLTSGIYSKYEYYCRFVNLCG